MNAAPITYIKDFATDLDFAALDAGIIWEQRDAPRAESYYAVTDVPYTYGRGAGERTYRPHTAYSTVLSTLRDRVQAYCSADFELLFCNRYEDAHQHLGWHADDSPSVDDARPIPVVSFGGAREIWFRENGKGSDVQKLLLASGSLLLMHAGMQQTHQHRIPKAGFNCAPRISLTFRGLSSSVDVLAIKAA